MNAARRKLQQELGIPPEQVQADCFTFVTKMHYGARMDDTWGEHEVDYILIARPTEDVTVVPNKNEVGEYRYFSKEGLKSFVRKAGNVDTRMEKVGRLDAFFPLYDSPVVHVQRMDEAVRAQQQEGVPVGYNDGLVVMVLLQWCGCPGHRLGC